MRYRFLRFPGGKPKAVTLSYDDGMNYDVRLVELCNQYGFKCTFNISTDFIAQTSGCDYLSADEIQKYLLDAGHEVAVHGSSHKALGLSSAIDGIQDVLNCRLTLESKFQQIIRGMAYADSGILKMVNGADYDNIRRYLQDLGIIYARTLEGDNCEFQLPTDWYAWMPTAHHNNPNIFDWIDAFLALNPDAGYRSSRGARLFYLWGHSFEFNKDQNWDRMETILKKLGGKSDTWYATNIEIREYIHAYDSLVFSADSSRVHNPTMMAVWFNADGTLYTVEPGQTIVIA